MINGKCPTWFVVKWLEKHPTHTANAYRERACINDGRVHFEHMPNRHDVWFTSEMLDPRSDWTIYNERGKRVRFRKRTELRKVGELGARERLTAHTGEYPRTIASNNTFDTFDVLIRERSR